MSNFEENINPIPQGKYVSATRFQNLIYTAGMTPRENGELILSGEVSAEQPAYIYKAAVRQSMANALMAAKHTLAEKESLDQVLTLTIYVNAGEGFKAHSILADFASEYLYEKMGKKGIGSRVAIGVSSLPGDAPIEIQLIVAVAA